MTLRLSPGRRLALALLLPAAVATALPAVAATERKKGGGLNFTQFETVTGAVMKADGSRGVLSVEAGIDVADGALRTRAAQMGPVLRDAYVQFIVRYAQALPPGALPNADVIGGEMQRATDRVLGRPGATLLLSSILVN
jgi:hypothetical protein